MNPLYGPDHLRMQVLPADIKMKTIEKYEHYLSTYVKHPKARRQFEGILGILRSEDESARLPEFLKWTRKLDGLRSESFKKTFPELSTLV